MSKASVCFILVALFGASMANSKPRARPTSYTDFLEKAMPGNGKGQEVVGPIDDFTCPHNGAFAYPDSCDLYVDCWEGAATLFRCTENMLFDLKFLGCNFAQYVDCAERPRPTNVPSTLTPPVSTTTTNYSTTTTPAPSSNFTCPGEGVFAHEEKCEYYWSCFAGEATLIHCQLDFLFDLVYMGCNFPELTHCQDRERPGDSPGTRDPSGPTSEGTVPTTTEVTGSTESPNPNSTTTATTPKTTTEGSGGDFECPVPDGFFADPTNCSRFYHCAFGEAILQECPAGLYFNPIAEACDFPENVDCSDRNRTRHRQH